MSWKAGWLDGWMDGLFRRLNGGGDGDHVDGWADIHVDGLCV